MGYISTGGISDVVSAATQVIRDPCLTTVAQRILTLRALEAKTPSKPSTAPPAPAGPGIGLCKAVKPLDAVIYVKARPWLLPVGAAAVVGLIWAVGYKMGRRR